SHFLDELGRNLAQEARRRRERLDAVHAPLLGIAEIKLPARARDADIAEPPLLLEARGIAERALMREQSVFHAAKEYEPELEAFGRMQRHELHAVLIRLGLAVARLEYREREELRERRQLAVLGAQHLARRVDEFLEVLDARFAARI